jgi:hypothetical protein
MYYLIIDNGVVVNIIVADSTFAAAITPQHQYVVATANTPGSPGIGWTYDGTNFAPPVIVVPSSG